jgi:heat shock protein HtpX
MLVMVTLSIILNLFNVKPYLNAYGLDYRSLMIFCLVWGMGGALISLSLSRVMAKWLMGVKVIDPNTHDPELSRLVSTIHQLARDAELPAMPQVGIYESAEVNAFATGPTRRRSLVAVSTGLLNRMSQKELEGVLAHEITHVANGDMVTMTLIQGIVNAFVMFLARVLAFALSGVGRSRNQSSSGGSYMAYAMFVFLFEVVFMLLGSIVIFWFSRLREYRADAGGAHLAGKDKMISALVSLQSYQKIRDQKAEKPSFEAMKISTSNRSGWMKLFSSHPPLEERIARLQNS